jgi:hypothetical protein
VYNHEWVQRRALVIVVAVVVAIGASHAIATAGPRDTARAKYTQAAELAENDDNEKALALVLEGLELAPKDLKLLQLRGVLLLKARDYEGALAAYAAYVDAGATGANKRAAQKIIASLQTIRTTFLEIDVEPGGPATVYVDAKSQGVFCTAAPSCNKGVLPNDYRIIVERPGFERWKGDVTAVDQQTTKLAVKLVELPSQVSVHVEPPGAAVAIDGKPVTSPATVAAGAHTLDVTLAHHVPVHQPLEVHEAKPVDLDVTLTPLVPVTMSRPAQLALDGAPVAVEDGGIVVPAGAHELVATAPGFLDAHVAIPAERGADYAISVALERIPPPPPPVVPHEPPKLEVGAGIAPGEKGYADHPALVAYRIDAGVRLRGRFDVGAYAEYGTISASGTCGTNIPGPTATGTLDYGSRNQLTRCFYVIVGAQLYYHFRPKHELDPWLGFTPGFRFQEVDYTTYDLFDHPTMSTHAQLPGLVASLRGGVDYRSPAWRGWAIGAFVEAQVMVAGTEGLDTNNQTTSAVSYVSLLGGARTSFVW